MNWIIQLMKTGIGNVLDYCTELPSALLEDARALLVPRARISHTGQLLLFLLAMGIIVLCYHLLAYRESNHVLPHWPELWKGIQFLYWDEWLERHVIWDDSKVSLMRLIPAVAITGVIGTVLGLYMGLWISANTLLSRFLEMIGGIPPILAMVLFIALFQFGLLMYIMVQFFGTITLVSTSVFLATRKIQDDMIDGFRARGASNTEIVWSLLFPELLPAILEAIRQSISPSIIYLIAAEVESGSDGWGHSFMQLYRAGRMEVIIPYLLFFGFATIGIRLLFHFVDYKLNHWNHLEVK